MGRSTLSIFAFGYNCIWVFVLNILNVFALLISCYNMSAPSRAVLAVPIVPSILIYTKHGGILILASDSIMTLVG